jgi:hypothetical protein
VKQHGFDAGITGALAEPRGLDAARFGFEKSGFKRVLKKISRAKSWAKCQSTAGDGIAVAA